MGFEPMNPGFADLQGAFALACPRFVPIVYSTDYRFRFQRIQAHLNRHPLHYPLQCKRARSANEILRNPNLPKTRLFGKFDSNGGSLPLRPNWENSTFPVYM